MNKVTMEFNKKSTWKMEKSLNFNYITHNYAFLKEF